MTTFFALLFVALLGIGMSRNIQYVQASKAYASGQYAAQGKHFPKYNFLLAVVGGLFAIVGLIGLICMDFDAALVGLIGSAAAAIPEILKANDLCRRLQKYNVKPSLKESPLGAYADVTLVGIGKLMHALMIFTIIGIPLYKTVENMISFVGAYEEQIKLRATLEALENQQTTDELIRQAEAAVAKKRKQ